MFIQRGPNIYAENSFIQTFVYKNSWVIKQLGDLLLPTDSIKTLSVVNWAKEELKLRVGLALFSVDDLESL